MQPPTIPNFQFTIHNLTYHAQSRLLACIVFLLLNSCKTDQTNKKAFVVEPGILNVMVCSSSVDIKSSDKFKVY